MRVLVLSGYETPSYPGGGGASRQHSLLEPLAKDHQIRVISTGDPPKFGKLPEGVDVRIVDPGEPLGPHIEPWLRKNVRHYLGGPPWLLRHTQHHVQALAAQALLHVPEFKPDLIQVEHGELLSILDLLPPGIPTVVVLHNMLFTYQAQRAQDGPAWQRVKEALELPLAALQTRRDLRKATLNVTVTNHDRRLAERLVPGARVSVVPNAINAAYLARRGAALEQPTVVMTGTFHYPPNQVAVLELIESILPAVRSRIPEAQLVLAGQGMPRWLAERVDRTPGATLERDLDDLRPYLWRSRVAIAPLRKGSGSPLKVMEAMAAGLPVVTTRRAARALEVGEADGVIAADSSADIASATVALLEDPGRRAELSARAVTSAVRRFDRAPAAQLQEQVWLEALAIAERLEREPADTST
jgi:glycosyltransferase involved in cell wall biosynthesis